MQIESPKHPAVLVLTGASGAGKTTLIEKLNEMAIPGVEGINCDRVNVPETPDGTDRQGEVLRYWLTRLAREDTKVELAVLDTQIRPSVAQKVLDQAEVEHSQIALVDCDHPIRNERLIKDRKQPDLANPQMDCWAAYLRGQADALNLSIIHTGNVSSDESFKQLETMISDLVKRARRLR